MGLNNSFHTKVETPLGFLSTASGTTSVLEVHHCNLALEILAMEFWVSKTYVLLKVLRVRIGWFLDFGLVVGLVLLWMFSCASNMLPQGLVSR